MNEFSFKITNVTFDLLQGCALCLDAVGSRPDSIFQWRQRGGRSLVHPSGWFGGYFCDVLPDVPMDGMDLIQDRGGLAMEAQHMDLAVDALSDGDSRFIQRAAGERKFFADASEQLKRQHSN